MAAEIVRSLADGPDYTPDWRYHVVQDYLADVMTAARPDARLAEILDTEKDPFIRQFLRFRFNGTAVNAAAFRYAVGCQERNPTTGAASMIKAMLVTGRTSEEIAVELGTQTRNIAAFAKIFFDVRRYLGNKAWLQRVVFSEPPEGMGEAEATRERRWLAAAYHRGWQGVEQVVFHRTTGKVDSVEALSVRLHETLASRALEFALDLETSGVAASETDFRRFLAARNTQSRQPPMQADNSALMNAFLRGMQSSMEKKVEQQPDDSALASLHEFKEAQPG